MTDFTLRQAISDKHMFCRKCGLNDNSRPPVVQYVQMGMMDSLRVSCARCGYSAEVPCYDAKWTRTDDCMCNGEHTGPCPSDRVSP